MVNPTDKIKLLFHICNAINRSARGPVEEARYKRIKAHVQMLTQEAIDTGIRTVKEPHPGLEGLGKPVQLIDSRPIHCYLH